MRGRGPATVIVTLGGDGVIVSSPNGLYRVGTMPVNCVDPSGGGDAFAAGVIRGLLEDWPIARCAQLGAVVGASCVQAVGCHDGVYDEATALQKLDKSPPPVEVLRGEGRRNA